MTNTTDGDKARADFSERAGRDLLERDKAYAASHGFTVKQSRGFWRVEHAGAQYATCLIESYAVAVAYALAMIDAGARLPG